MVSFFNNSLSSEQPIIVAKEIIASFLKQPQESISCTLLTGGSEEAKIVKCTHHITNYVVKIFSSSQAGKNEIAWTKLASDLGVGPTSYYVDPAENYMVIDFVAGNSLVPTTANIPHVIKSLAKKLRLLHHSSAPFAHASDMFERIDIKYKKLTVSGGFYDLLEKSFQSVKSIQGLLEDLTVSLAPCHNDLNPGNIFVHNDQVTLIDWGDAALGNPYYDIAAFFVLNVIEAEGQKLFFEHYDKKLLSPEWQHYIYLCKQVVYFEFALNLLGGVQAGNNELLHEPYVPEVEALDYYLTRLAMRDIKIDSTFLYSMALASLNKISLIKEPL